MTNLQSRPAWRGLSGMVSLLCLVLLLPGLARASEERTVSPALGTRLIELMALDETRDWATAIAGYDGLLDRDRLSPYERATILTLRGRTHYAAGDTARAIADWRTAIALDALAPDDLNALRINTGQLLMATDEIRAGLNLIEAALANGAALNSEIAFRLAQGYGQLGEYSPGIVRARQALALAEPIERRHYSLLLYFVQQLGFGEEELSLMEAMVQAWPDEKAGWASYAALLARADREEDAFGINRIMYLNGMLTESDEIVRLAQYYSHYEYPYRGAVLLERELNAGRVEPVARNLTLLANLWRQAREWDRAMPVLRRVATSTGAGADFERLGEALYQSAQYVEAEAMFDQALRRGNLNRPGDTWTLIGNARVEQGKLVAAIEAFSEALRWDYSRATAQGWIDYIERKIAITETAAALPLMVTIEDCRFSIEEMRRTVPTASDPGYDELGRRLFALPTRCTPYFNVYGELFPEYERA